MRKLADLDSWIVTACPTENINISEARAVLWEYVKKYGTGNNAHNFVKRLQLPISLRNSRRGNFTAGIVENLPNTLPPMNCEIEADIVNGMTYALNKLYSLNLDTNVGVVRGVGANSIGRNEGRIAIIGASHAGRYGASPALKSGRLVQDLPRWTPTDTTTRAAKQKLLELKLTSNDTLILDIFSNSVYMGNNALGCPSPPFQDEDGNYHIEGPMGVAPLRALRIIAEQGAAIMTAASPAKCIVVLPVPRYVNASCCGNANHITNRAKRDYADRGGAHVPRNYGGDPGGQRDGGPSLL
jgi:hypothetical protein